jgi:hypothetical protein
MTFISGERFVLQNDDICKRNDTAINSAGVFLFSMMTFINEATLGNVGERFLLQNN